MKWTKDKPTFTKECLLLTASKIKKEWYYRMFEIRKVEYEELWYWGLMTPDGDEWEDLDDLYADLYCKLPLLKK